jgi:hypothetical protein
LVKVKDLGEDVECPICGTKTSPNETECPECGEILEDVLVLEAESGGRMSRVGFRIGLMIFLLGFLIMIYSFLHDGLGTHGVPSFVPGYDAYNVFGPYNYLVVYAGTGVMIPGIVIMLLAFVVGRIRSHSKIEKETPAEMAETE